MRVSVCCVFPVCLRLNVYIEWRWKMAFPRLLTCASKQMLQLYKQNNAGGRFFWPTLLKVLNMSARLYHVTDVTGCERSGYMHVTPTRSLKPGPDPTPFANLVSANSCRRGSEGYCGVWAVDQWCKVQYNDIGEHLEPLAAETTADDEYDVNEHCFCDYILDTSSTATWPLNFCTQETRFWCISDGL